MKIGFFMGSFDPIHVGHINMIREVINKISLDKVIVVPSGHNPWKKDIVPAPFDLRVAMIAAAIKPFGDKVEVSDIESTFEPPYYANKPLNYFREKYKGEELYIICGSDTIDYIPYWKDAVTDILPFYQIICLERDDNGLHTCDTLLTRYTEDKDGNKYPYFHYCIRPISISSTYIRRQIKENKNIYPLLPVEVIEIIEKNNLYKK